MTTPKKYPGTRLELGKRYVLGDPNVKYAEVVDECNKYWKSRDFVFRLTVVNKDDSTWEGVWTGDGYHFSNRCDDPYNITGEYVEEACAVNAPAEKDAVDWKGKYADGVRQWQLDCSRAEAAERERDSALVRVKELECNLGLLYCRMEKRIAELEAKR